MAQFNLLSTPREGATQRREKRKFYPARRSP